MPSHTKSIEIPYQVDSTLLLSAEEYQVLYLTDIPLAGLNGEILDDRTIEEKIQVATEQIENLLSIKIPKQEISEEQDFEREHFEMWGAIKCNYLINEVTLMEGRLNFARQIQYPLGWISLKRALDKRRMMFLVPGQQEDLTGINNDFVAVFTGKFPIFGYSSANYIPNYWNLNYITGFEKVPKDIADAVGKIATMQILAILGDIAFGAGIASKSLSIDGLSQSIGTTQSAENSLYSARIRQFERELKNELRWLKNKYGSIPTVAL